MSKDITLKDVPEALKEWAPISEYNKKWDFISYKPRYRLSEQLASIDYQITLYNWLKPNWSFEENHKRLIIVMIAGVYEVVLADLLEQEVSQKVEGVPERFINKENIDRIDNSQVFEDLINDCRDVDLISDKWREYLHKIRDVRNWIHLNKERKESLSEWVENQSLTEIREKVDKFYNEVKPSGFGQEDFDLDDIPF